MGVPPAKGAPRWVWPVVGLLLFVLTIAGGVAGLARFKAQQSSGLARVTANGDAGVTRITSQGDTGISKITAEPSAGATRITAPPPEVTKQLPAHIRDYLLHVERTERMREATAGKHLGTAQTLMAELTVGGGADALKALLSQTDGSDSELPKPSDKAKANIEEMNGEWNDIRAYFNKVQPPPECQVLRDRFDAAINMTGGMMLDLVDILANVGSDTAPAVAKLESMKGKSASIDRFAKDANSEVKSICAKYDTRPWFEIQSDFGSSGGIAKFLGR